MARRSNPLDCYLTDLPPGRLEWIGLRSTKRGLVETPTSARAIVESGLEGDHRATRSSTSGRQVTLISVEFIDQIAHFLDRADIDPALLRRNLVVSGLNLHALRHQRIRVGEALLEPNALCHPCLRMEAALGPGAVAAMYGHGGLCCRVLEGGTLRLGDPVRLESKTQS